MRANPAPDNMRFAWSNFRSILEGRTAIRRPGHFEDASGLPHTLDSQPWPEPTVCTQVIYHLTHSNLEASFLFGGQAIPVPQERIGTKESGHRRLFFIEGCQKGFL